MYWRHQLTLVVLFAVTVTWSVWCELTVDHEGISAMLTVVSIILGFTMASAVTMGDSEFLEKQSKQVDKKVSGVQMSNAQRLGEYVSFTGLICLVSIVLLLVMRIANVRDVLAVWLNSVAIGLVVVSVVMGFFVLRVVVNFVRGDWH